jgi:DNA-binding NarL/FixJ family response regulator
VTVVVGVDGSGRTHRLRTLAAAATGSLWWPTDLAGAGDRLVVVDDAHCLDPIALRDLTAACRAGVPVLISRRPTVDRPELAGLDEVASAGGVELLTPLDRDQIAVLIATSTGRPVSPDVAAAVHLASAGLPSIAAAIATAPAGSTPPALLARVQRRFAVLDSAVVTVARVLALRLDLTDRIIAAACGVDMSALAAAVRMLRDEGLLVPEPGSASPARGSEASGGGTPGPAHRGGPPMGERMIPAVADAVLVELPGAERRRLHDAVAGALVEAGADPVIAAGQLRAARASTTIAAGVYREAGERLRFADPAAALGWFDDAADAGADLAGLAAGRAEAGTLLGLAVDVPDGDGRLALVAGAVAAHQGRAARAASLLVAAPAPGPALAVPSLIGIGRIAEAREAAATVAPAAFVRLAEGVLAAGEPAVALPLLIEAAEAAERGTPPVVLPDTPHALAAVVAVAAGDVTSAEHLLARARAARVGGPVADERHRLLLAWARMRAGRYETALRELRRPDGVETSGRDRMLRAVLAAGIARRRGDIAGLRDAWTGVEPLLARRAVDLWQLEATEELAVAAARLRRLARVEPVLALLDEIVAGLGRPAGWVVALDWLRLQTAIATDDAAAAAEVAGRMAGVDAGEPRPFAQCVAAGQWAAVLAGRVDTEAVLAASEDLLAAELPWEASRLAGQAAIRTADASAARRLLERARELSEPDTDGPGQTTGGLSEREVTVARLVLAGSTHREIGAQLYIAPKTVEHHVARIRGKLGASTRAELLAMLREMLGD